MAMWAAIAAKSLSEQQLSERFFVHGCTYVAAHRDVQAAMKPPIILAWIELTVLNTVATNPCIQTIANLFNGSLELGIIADCIKQF